MGKNMDHFLCTAEQFDHFCFSIDTIEISVSYLLLILVQELILHRLVILLCHLQRQHQMFCHYRTRHCWIHPFLPSQLLVHEMEVPAYWIQWQHSLPPKSDQDHHIWVICCLSPCPACQCLTQEDLWRGFKKEAAWMRVMIFVQLGESLKCTWRKTMLICLIGMAPTEIHIITMSQISRDLF